MDVLSIDSMKESSYLPKVCPSVDLDFGIEKDNFGMRDIPRWISQFSTLCQRNLREKVITWDIFALNVCVTIIVSIFIGTGA